MWSAQLQGDLELVAVKVEGRVGVRMYVVAGWYMICLFLAEAPSSCSERMDQVEGTDVRLPLRSW